MGVWKCSEEEEGEKGAMMADWTSEI